jgi:hypothetical protein
LSFVAFSLTGKILEIRFSGQDNVKWLCRKVDQFTYHYPSLSALTGLLEPCFILMDFPADFPTHPSNIALALMVHLPSPLSELWIGSFSCFGFAQCCRPAGGREGTRRDYASGKWAVLPGTALLWAVGFSLAILWQFQCHCYDASPKLFAFCRMTPSKWRQVAWWTWRNWRKEAKTSKCRRGRDAALGEGVAPAPSTQHPPVASALQRLCLKPELWWLAAG